MCQWSSRGQSEIFTLTLIHPLVKEKLDFGALEVKWTESLSVVSDSLWPHGLHSPWNSLGQNTGVGSLSLLRGVFPTRGLNPGLPHCRQILYQLSHMASLCALTGLELVDSSWWVMLKGKKKKKSKFNDDPCKFKICIRFSSFSKSLCLIIFLPLDHLVSVNEKHCLPYR